MKTNQRRGFVDTHHSKHGQLVRLHRVKVKTTELGDKVIAAKNPGYDHANGHRGIARAKHGAKKFIRTRLRFHENMELSKQLKEI